MKRSPKTVTTTGRVAVAALVCLVLVVSLAGCGGSLSRAGVTAKTAENAYTAVFYDDRVGVSVGYSGLTLYTADGGTTWLKGANASLCLFGAECVDAAHFIAAGNGSNVRKTADGGKTWTACENIVGRGKSLSFLDPERGWAASPGWIGETLDGGATWKPIALPSGALVETVVMKAPGAGYYVSSTGELLETTDCGASWKPVSTPFAGKGDSFIPSYKTPFQGIAVRLADDSGFAVAVGKIGTKPFLIARRSTDGGKTWSKAGKYPLPRNGMTVSIGPTGAVSAFLADGTVMRFLN